MKRLLLAVLMFAGIASAQVTTSVTGTVKDLSNAAVTSGQVSFTLQPGIDTSMSGTARFTPTEIDCTITGTGAVKALDGVSTCTVTNNTALQPSGTSYKVCIQPSFIQPGSCFVWYALGAATDITAQIPTPPLTPAYNLVDTFSNQSIAGNKTFSGNITFGGSLSLGSITLGGPLTDLFGGTLGGTFAGNITWSGNQSIGGTLGVTGAVAGPSFGSTAANPATSGFERLAIGDTQCWRNFANGGNVCLSDAGAASSATGNLPDNLKWSGGGYQAAAFVDGSVASAQTGVVRTGNNVCAVASRNAAASGDVCAVQVNGSNQVVIPAASLASPTSTGTDNGSEIMQNKAFTGAATGNSVNLFTSGCPPQGLTASINGTGAPADIFTCPLPANVIENNKILHVVCSGFHDTNTTNVSMTMNINGQNIVTGSTGTTASQSWSMEAYILRTGTTTGQAWGAATIATGNNGTMAAFSLGLTGLSWTSGTQTLNCQFTVAAGDHMTGRVWAPMSIQ